MGKLIVIEGLDGSGKATQSSLLTETLEKAGKAVRKISFPNYESNASWPVRMYLGGEFGPRPEAVNAYAASTFCAVDRYASYVQDWRQAYEAGDLFLSDRYTTSNAVHQGGKVAAGERTAFFRWLYDLEYNRMELPRPDLVVLLDMPTELSEQLLRRREVDTHTQADIHEQDRAYLTRCRETAREAAAHYGWSLVSCARDGRLRTVEEIHEELYALVRRTLET